MATSTKVYNAKNMDISVGGIPISTGLADGTFLTITYKEDDVELTIGTDGEAAVSVTNNRSADMTITLMQTSTAHKEMMILLTASRATPNGVLLFPFLASDPMSGLKFFAPQAFIMKMPDAEYSRGIEDREWVLSTGCLIVTPF